MPEFETRDPLGAAFWDETPDKLPHRGLTACTATIASVFGGDATAGLFDSRLWACV